MKQIKQLLQLGMLLACGLLVSCSSDDELTNGNGTPLPDGEYPLMLTATMEGELTTRAAGKDTWTVGDVVGARIGIGTAGSYTIANASGALNATAPVYWQNTALATVTAWYPANARNNVNISNQSAGFAQFDYLKAEVPNSTYNQSNIALPFKHQMAKVRVTINSVNNTDLTNAEVRIFGRPSLSYSEGTVTSSAANAYIIPQPDGSNIYEALLVPQQMQGTKFISVKLNNGNTYSYTPASATDANLQANQLYSYAIDVDGVTTIDPSLSMPTLTAGTYIIDGTGKGPTTNRIVIDGNPTVILKNVNIAVEHTAIEIKKGSPIIIIDGESTVQNILLASTEANVTIQGESSNSSKLTVNSAYGEEIGHYGIPAGIGSIGYDGNGGTMSDVGNITIKNITLDVTGHQGAYNRNGGAAIGVGGGNLGSCGDITITDAVVHATGGWGAAAIGSGCIASGGQKVGNITITNTQIYATVTYSSGFGHYGAGIGLGGLAFADRIQSCGNITIISNESVATFFGAGRFKAVGSDSNTEFYKVGKASTTVHSDNQVWSGVTFNGTPLAGAGAVGYK